MKILITGIGCIGKSSLRERLALTFPDKVISVDMDYTNKIPSDKDKVVIVESVHGLEENPQMFDKILYLLPPRRHPFLWLKRAWAWFSTGIVDLSDPKGKKKIFAISNIPIILKIVVRNIYLRRRWVKSDKFKIKEELINKTYIISSVDEGYWISNSWIVDYLKSNELFNIQEVK